MKELTGSEKQIKWAVEIRSRYMETASTLKEALAITRNLEQTETVIKDPVFGDETIKEYKVSTTNSHLAAIYTALKALSMEEVEYSSKILTREKELIDAGSEHPTREAQTEALEDLEKRLTSLIENETSAKFWIDHR